MQGTCNRAALTPGCRCAQLMAALCELGGWGCPGRRGLLDAQSRTITETMLIAAARALAAVVTPGELGPNCIVPSVFHPNVASTVAAAVRGAATPVKDLAGAGATGADAGP
jgi:hypothetical protein